MAKNSIYCQAANTIDQNIITDPNMVNFDNTFLFSETSLGLCAVESNQLPFAILNIYFFESHKTRT